MAQVPDYFFCQSAVIPVREREGNLEVLLITSRKRKRWVIPKGVKEPDMTGPDSAAREALEEAGIEGLVLPSSLGRYEYDKWGGTCSVDVYLMQVSVMHETWQEQYRDREWVDVDTAAERMREPVLKDIVRNLPVTLSATAGTE